MPSLHYPRLHPKLWCKERGLCQRNMKEVACQSSRGKFCPLWHQEYSCWFCLWEILLDCEENTDDSLDDDCVDELVETEILDGKTLSLCSWRILRQNSSLSLSEQRWRDGCGGGDAVSVFHGQSCFVLWQLEKYLTLHKNISHHYLELGSSSRGSDEVEKWLSILFCWRPSYERLGNKNNWNRKL